MTKTDELKIVRDFWDSKQMKYLKPGDPVPEDEALVERMRDLGYLKTDKEIQAERNPEAAQATTQVEQLEADLALAQAKVSELEQKVSSLEGQEGGDTSSVQTLQAQLQTAQAERDAAVQERDANAQDLVTAQTELQTAQASLTEYQTAVGELLPEGLNVQARKGLISKGYVGKTLIGLLTDAQLIAVNGVAEGSLETLRKWAPFSGSADAPPAGE